ncbi:MAG: caspase family protein [Duncaniella sp.]|nr:caspase family protein [Duncaniella sp.]
MRFFFCLISFSIALFSNSYTLSNRVESAFQSLQHGEIENAIGILKRAAGTNDVLAQYYIAQCYEYGIGVNKDITLAFSTYRRAAERGFPPAMLELARCYRMGIGVTSDIKRADEWQKRYDNKNFHNDLPHIAEFCKSRDNNTKTTGENNLIADDIRIETKVMDSEPKSVNSNETMSLTEYHNPKYDLNSVSDVDIDIPFSSIKSDNTFALIISNENYQDVAKVANALNDGEIFAQYCRKTLGIPESNIHLVKDATLNNIKREINLIRQIAEAYDGQASFLIYYSGHGFPDEKTGNAYLMPVDGYTSDLSTCYAISDFYEIFGTIPSQRNIILIDACFSGSARGNEMLYAARGIRIKAKTATPKGNTVVISSSQGDETAYPYIEKSHGLFTYYLLKQLKDSCGQITLGELFESLKDNVKRKSLVINGKSQTPTVSATPNIVNEWHNWKLY